MSEHVPSAPEVRELTPRPSVTRTTGPARPSRFRWLWLPMLIVFVAAAYYLWPKAAASPGGTAPSTENSGKKGGGRGGRGGIPPVVAVRAHRGDIGVYLTGLGAATPIYTVTVKTRVDGQLMEVHYKEGDMVHRGDPLLEIDPRPYQVQLEQYEGQLARDQAALDNAKIDLARYETLLKQNAIPEQQYATQKTAVAQDEGVVKTDRGLIDSAQLNLTYCHITAPISGRIGLRLVDPGNIVHATDSTGLLVITQIQPISVIFTIAEDQLGPVLARWRKGQRLPVEAWDRALQHRIAMGTLATMDNQIDQTTGTLRIRADFPNQDNALFPNQFVNARLLVEQKHGVVLVPTAAIQRNTSNTYVFVVNPDTSVSVRNVTEGTTEGDESEITSGLAPGDEVAMTGVDKLAEGVKVTAQVEGERSAPRAGGKKK